MPSNFKALEDGLKREYPESRFRGCKRVLSEDLGLVAAVWVAHDPSRKKEVLERLQAAGSEMADGPSTRFVLTWETDDNDVDFHIEDGQGGHAYYAQPGLPSGGSLYADVTTGYGPECTLRLKAEEGVAC